MTKNTTNLMTASNEWATRPDDQRYVSLEALENAVRTRKNQCWTGQSKTNELRVVPNENGDLRIRTVDVTRNQEVLLKPTHWSFGQLAQYAQAPATYLRTLPSEIAAINLQWGLERNPVRPESLILAQENGGEYLRAMTSPSYGRIWDIEVVEAVKRVNPDGRWKVPAASYATQNPKRATTLYASDRDVFIFLVDDQHPIEVDGKPLFRGFYTWNSEVGSAVFGLTTFLYERVCDNRIVWGATDVQELRIRHTGGAPERFAYEGVKYLNRYADESTQKLIEGIKIAQNKEIPVNKGKEETVQDWLKGRGFTQSQAKGAVESAVAEEGQCRTVWDIVNGITAYARSIVHTDARVELEVKAGKLMDSAVA